MAMVSSCSSSTRPLAQQLLRTRGQGIAVFVQQRVHSTSVGVEATTAFVQQLLTELEASVAVLDAEKASALELSDEREIELGTLISASSLTIRYVTERDAMTPVLQRFRAAFQAALRFPCCTKALLGLKMVSLMGTTRVLESFSQHVEAGDVARDLQWLYKQFIKQDGEDNATFVERVNYLFRPACEQLTVAVQSHPVVQQTVYDELVPALFELAPAFLEADVADAVAGELMSTLAIVFDLRLPSPTQSAFSLLPMPRFAQEESEVEAADEENIHILQRQDEPDESVQCATATLPAADVVSAFAETVATWMSIGGRRQSVIAALPHICGAMAAAQMDAPCRLLCTTLLASLESLDLEKASDFEYFQSGIECARDLGLRNAVPSGLERDVYAVLKTAMPRLQAALKCLSVEPGELRAIKTTCSKTRDSLVEAFTWWIHYAACKGDLAHLREEFIGSVVDKLADPRIHGDLLYVSRRFLDEPSFEAAVEAAAAPLIRAVKQLDRYSKVAASRVIAGVARVAIAAGTAIDRFVDALAGPLLSQVLDGSRKGRAGRLNAVACLLLSCTPDADFSLDDREWIQQFIGVLLEASASQSVHSMVILDHLVRSDVRIRGVVARAAADSQELVRHIIHNSLSSWPIFTEDMDAVLLVLAILSSLLVEDQLRATIDVPAMTSTVEKLRENAQADEQSDLVDACNDVLKALACS